MDLNLLLESADITLLESADNLLLEQERFTATLTAYINGHYALNSFVTLHTEGANPANDDLTLFVDGVGISTRAARLYIEGHSVPSPIPPPLLTLNTYMPMCTYGGAVGTTQNAGVLPLVCYAKYHTDTITLYIPNTQIELNFNRACTLFVEGGYLTKSTTLPLTISGAGTSAIMTLSVWGAGVWDGWHTYSDSIPLYINRENIVGVLPLFVKAATGISNTYTTLHTISTVDTTGTLTLAISGAYIPTNTYTTLFTEGMTPFNANTPLYTMGYTILNGTMTLAINPNSGTPNTYMPLYVDATYHENATLTLVVPAVVAYDNTPLSLHTFGW